MSVQTEKVHTEKGSRPKGTAEARTLRSLINEFESHNGHTALIAFTKSGSTHLSYSKLLGIVQDMSAHMAEIGLKKGDNVIICAPNSIAWVTSCLSVIYSGATAVPVDSQQSSDVLKHIIEDSKSKLIFTDARGAERLHKLFPRRKLQILRLDAGRKDKDSWRSLISSEFDEALEAEERSQKNSKKSGSPENETAKIPESATAVKKNEIQDDTEANAKVGKNSKDDGSPGALSADDTALLFYTSGTTGMPKGVPLTHANILLQLDSVLAKTDLLRPADRVLLPLPLFHVYPLNTGLLLPLRLGLPVILPRSITGPEIMRAISQGRATVLVGVPRLLRSLYEAIESKFNANKLLASAYSALLGMSQFSDKFLMVKVGKLLFSPVHRNFGPTLRLFTSGGAPLDGELAAKLRGLGWDVAVGYGLTETSPLLALRMPSNRDLAGVGPPIQGVQIRITPLKEETEEAGETEVVSGKDDAKKSSAGPAKADLNESAGKATAAKKTSLPDSSKESTSNESDRPALEEPRQEELGEPSAKNLGEPTAKDLGEPSARSLGEPSAKELGEPTAKDLGEPTAKELGEPITSHVDNSSVKSASKTPVEPVGKARTDDESPQSPEGTLQDSPAKATTIESHADADKTLTASEDAGGDGEAKAPELKPKSEVNQSKKKDDTTDKRVGEIQAKGPNVFAGYRNLPDVTAEAFSEDGWFKTGDLGYFENGNLHVTGRASSTIVMDGGEKIQPDDIEDAIAQYQGIQEIALLQMEHKLVALVVPDLKAVGDSDLTKTIASTLKTATANRASYLQVTDFAVTREPLPKTNLGKLKRGELQDRYSKAKASGGKGKTDGSEPSSNVEQLSADDRELLEEPAAASCWEWLKNRHPDETITFDTSPQMDLHIDSLEWMNLTLELLEETGVELSEDTIARIATVRDLLKEIVISSAAGTSSEDSPLREPEHFLDDKQKEFLEPLNGWQSSLAEFLYSLTRRLMSPFPTKSTGAENLPKGQVVFTPNHASYIDAFAIAAVLPYDRLKDTQWAGWTGIAYGNPIFSFFSRIARVFPIEAKRSLITSLALGAAVLKQNKSLIWFPEGERTLTGELLTFRPGIGMLLQDSTVPVVPVYLRGTREALFPGKFFPHFNKITVHFGEPVLASQLLKEGEGKTPAERIANAIQARVQKLKDTPSDA